MPIRRSSKPSPLPDGLFFALMLAGLATGGLACGGSASDPSRNVSEATETAGRPTISEGMTMAQVIEIWGPPNVKVRQGAGERWSYWVRDGRQQLVGKAYVIFDDEKKVSEVVTRSDHEPPEPKHAPVTAT
jgi:hypothetical protein